MIAGIFHQGSGLGNQLHRYVATRVLALDKGHDFSMVSPELFKGKSFMDLDMGWNDEGPFNHFPYEIENGTGKVIPRFRADYPLWEEKTNYYNPEFNFIEDDTIIDGEFQDERYFSHRLKKIDEWLKVEPLDMPHDLCIINFRGGEYKLFPELYLTQEYWDKAIGRIRSIYNGFLKANYIRFEVHTDDVEEAKKFFPDFPIIHNMGLNWRSIRYAKHLILANSSFGILPALLNKGVEEIIAPRYWARRNIKEWSMPQNYYKRFTYL